MTGLFIISALFLMTAVLIVPFSKKKGLGSVLGYLIAGVGVGLVLREFAPLLGFKSSEALVEDLKHFTEFGVVLMLFLIGLEMQPSQLWNMRGAIFGMGGLQVGITTACITACVMMFGLSFNASLVIGLSLALSSTAIIMQTLNEKRLINTKGGQTSFSVLLFQDIAVIPIIAVIPLLAATTGSDGSGHGVELGLPGWLQAPLAFGAIVFIYLFARFAVNPLFRYIAKSKLHEVFTTAALGLVMLIAAITSLFGISPALGVFIAGVVLSESEFRHEIELEIEPFKGLLLGLFFMAVGASFNFQLFGAMPFTILGLSLGLMLLKFVVLLGIVKAFKVEWSQSLLFALALAQGGEFAFVLVGEATSVNLFDDATASIIKLVVAISMALTPGLFILYEKLIYPRFMDIHSNAEKAPDEIEEQGQILVAGFGRFSQIIVRLLSVNGFSATILDNDPDHITLLRKFGWKVFYGDASRVDLLHSAGLDSAKLLIVGIDDHEKAVELIKEVKKHRPDLKIFARARGRLQLYELKSLGVEEIYRETFDTSLKVGEDALKAMGFRSYQAKRARLLFETADHKMIDHLAKVWLENRDMLIDEAIIVNKVLEQTLKESINREHTWSDAAWSSGEADVDKSTVH